MSGNKLNPSKNNESHPHQPINPKMRSIILSCSFLLILAGSLLLNLQSVAIQEIPLNASIMVLLFFFAVICILSLSLLTWSYFTRTVYLKEGPALVPERWGEVINDISLSNREQISYNKVALQKLIESVNNSEKKYDELLSSFLLLQKNLSERDAEIKRLKQGHDFVIFKKFLSRFVKIDRSLCEMSNQESEEFSAKELNFLIMLMADALEECGVQKTTIDIGTDYRTCGAEVADNPDVVENHEGADDFGIISVKSPAYVLPGEGPATVLSPAKVTINRKK